MLLAGAISTCLAQGTIDLVEYDIYNDTVHEEWYASSQKPGLATRADDRVNFGPVSYAAITVLGYTVVYGAEQAASAIDACAEYQGGNTKYRKQCFKDAFLTAASYGLVGVAGYKGQAATIALLQGSLNLANTINGNQGQGPSQRRMAAHAVSRPPYFNHGHPNITDDVIDSMNYAVDVAYAQMNETAESVEARSTESQPCTNRNSDLTTKGHYYRFTGENGLKLQCKNGCGDTDFNSNSMASIINYVGEKIVASKDLNAQFTVYDNTNGKVFARCKSVIETVVTNTCPESISGSGCTF